MPTINDHTFNGPLTTPAVTIATGYASLTASFGAFYMKANGQVAYLAAANASTLVSATLVAPFPNGTAAVAGALDYDDDSTAKKGANCCRVYTLIARVNMATLAVTTFWLAGADFPKALGLSTDNIPRAQQSNDVEVGYVYLKNETSAFTPGTSVLTLSGLTVQYIQNLALQGS